ncbi:MAG: tetratricopeptide repeat protein [Planctomycetes bacterium]|nr:tetratricopeptide repeat protein [Planctomycetota bacterium]
MTRILGQTLSRTCLPGFLLLHALWLGGCGPSLTIPAALPSGTVGVLMKELITPQIQKIDSDPGNAEHHGTLGLMYEANEMWEPAARAFEAAVTLDPANPLWTLHLHTTRNSVGVSSGELARLESQASRFSDEPSFLYILGLARFDAGDLNGARSAFAQSLQLAPGVAAPLVALSKLELISGQPQKALELASKALQQAPGHPAVFNARGQAYRALGQAERAASDLKAGLNASRLSYPDEGRLRFSGYYAAPQMLINHSADLIEAGFAPRAEILLHKVLTVNPDDKDALNNLALALRAMNRNSQASTRLQAALKIDSDYFPTLINLSDLHLALEDPITAELHASRAVEIDSENPIAYKLLGMSLIRQRKFPQAIVAFEKSLSFQPDDFECHAAAGEAALASRILKTATKHLRAAALLNPDHLPVQVNLIFTLIRSEQFDEADQRLKKLFKQVGQHPQLIKAHDALQQARRTAGEKQ